MQILYLHYFSIVFVIFWNVLSNALKNVLFLIFISLSSCISTIGVPSKVDRLKSSFSGIKAMLHAAEYDVRCLRRDFGFTFATIFDTLIAARLLQWEQVGLGNILESEFGVQVNKRHQRADWGQRPLSPALVRYAQVDTHYLLSLHDKLAGRLRAGGFMEEAAELFAEICEVEWTEAEFDPDGFWQIKGARDLPPASLAVLRELYVFRENQAIQRDQPLFKIMGDQTLLDLAGRLPRSMNQLQRIPGMSEGQIRRYGRGILEAVQRGLQAAPPRHPSRGGRRLDDLILQRYETLHAWRKERAQARGIPSEFVLSREALWELAQVAPRSRQQLDTLRSLGPWRRKTYGDDILKVLAGLDGRQAESQEG